MSLDPYHQKRDFDRTPEPSGDGNVAHGSSKSEERLSFVIQKHDASRLHYDFRLEWQGTLKSWAVPKGPGVRPGDKALAVHVEDHPLEYAGFEGVIPAGQYGGGTVMVWDRGTWEPLDDVEKGFRKGQLKFELFGEKLRGRWRLVRMHGKPNERQENWLLIKSRDDHQLDLSKEEDDRSVISGRSMAQIADAADSVWTNGAKSTDNGPADALGADTEPQSRLHPPQLAEARKADFPKELSPALATLAGQAPQSDAWLHELKFDGYRLLAYKQHDTIRLVTRRGNDWTDRFPKVEAALQAFPAQAAILDGEVVVLAPDGTTSFQALQNSMRQGRAEQHTYFAFDLLYLDGYDLRACPLFERKQLLSSRLDMLRGNVIRYSDHLVGSGRQFLEQACGHRAEGVISKRVNSTYSSGRTRDWVKSKCRHRQEFVVGGYTTPSGKRSHFGALLLGVYDDDGNLEYVGRVGTGFDQATLEDVHARLTNLRTSRSPFRHRFTRAENAESHWVEPGLVAEVSFAKWTDDGRLREASFHGLREDKEAGDVRREDAGPQSTSGPGSKRRAAEPRTIIRGRNLEREGVKITNPDRVFYPESQDGPPVTKLDLVDYYLEIQEHILPHLVERPLTMVRCPGGYEKECFYQKHLTESLPEALRGVEIEERGKRRTYVTLHDVAGLVAMAQMGVLEIHPWPCRADRLDRPDRLVLDLDPDESIPFSQVGEAALELRDRLEELGLRSFLRTTGGKGLHVVVPIERRTDWDDAKQFTRRVAEEFVRRDPERFTATSSKARRTGKIYIDYLRNSRGATAIASYSTRARAGCVVATPLEWSELTASLDPRSFDLWSVPKRLAGRAAWHDFFECRQVLTKAMHQEVRPQRTKR